MSRVGDANAVLRLVPLLKKQNMAGANIYIRPDAEGKNVGILLLDDLSSTTLTMLRDKNFQASAVTETSPSNYQAWVRIADHDIAAPLATGCAKALAKLFGADPNSADWRHYGRLSGFTNRKPKHVDNNGKFPYVLCISAAPQVAEGGAELMRQVQRDIDSAAAALALENAQRQKTVFFRADQRDPIAIARETAKFVAARHAQIDLSRVDFQVAIELARQGFDDSVVISALRQTSHDIETRKAGHVDDYLSRTAKKAREVAAGELF